MQSDIIDLTTPEASPGTAVVEENPLAVAKLTPPDVLLVVFVHGLAEARLRCLCIHAKTQVQGHRRDLYAVSRASAAHPG
jgi:hypothetical protein